MQTNPAIHANSGDQPEIESRERETPASVSPIDSVPRLAFSVAEAAKMLGVSEKTVRRLVLRGLLKPSRALRHLRFTRAEIERFLRETM